LGFIETGEDFCWEKEEGRTRKGRWRKEGGGGGLPLGRGRRGGMERRRRRRGRRMNLVKMEDYK
jgi:hypothetical protein